ncbi:GntR family transcriptional regulator [Mesorhizobium sp. Z1-4]|uniref:GntR family transcriptional regulator n=1 Tax=Mesorhizobium sp. Z1-4 TaxID=2448478 RepID=UPI000FD730FB|nr:GntR family transcriptional regulator [Mesorhizobium sp. Z1-4]
MLSFDKVETRSTVVLQVYQQMKRSILRGELPTGYRIVEVNIAEAFGVSRTPVREAISRLIAQGFIKEQGNVKVVADISVSMSEINGIRTVLESYAARLAAENATDEDLRVISEYCNSSVLVDGSSPLEKRAMLNDSFHEAVARASYNERLIKMIADFYEYALTEEMLVYYSKADTEAHAEQHRSIVKALCERDPDAAEEAMRAHITSIGRVIERAITQMKPK